MAKQPTRTNNSIRIAEPTPRWVAVRTKPGSQMPKRFFRTERVRSKKGYRLAPTVNPDLSAVENALGQAGFDCYMPAEQRLQKDRRRPFVWTPRRFALMVGYVFVRDPQDIDALERVPGVQSVVRDGVGRPLEISIQAIMDIRAVEAALEVEFDERSRAARQALRRRAKKDPTIEKIVQSLDIAGKLTVPFELEPVAA